MIHKLSVVVVGYRSCEPLCACLESLESSASRMPLEVIVVDNASGDGTLEMLAARFPKAIAIANTDNHGFTRAVNQGLERSTGDLLLVLNPDCVVNPLALERLVRAILERPEAAAVAPMLVDGDDQPARSCGRFPSLWTLFCDHLGLAQSFPDSHWFGRYKYGGRSLSSLDRVDWGSGAALMIPRAAYLKVGGLDENIFMYMEEVDWCRRAARAGLTVHFIPTARIVHHGQQSSRQVPGATYLHNLRSRVYYFRKHHGPLAAALAKGILLVSLALKWTASVLQRARRSGARVYAQGLEIVWAA